MAEQIVLDSPEEWRECPGFPDYSVSNHGRVRRDVTRNGYKAGRILSGSPSIYGYPQTVLSHRGERRTCKIHRLVALAFLGDPPEGKPNVNHLNCIRNDNRVENLEWASYQDDADHRVQMGTVPCGDGHWARRHPERVARGDRHISRIHPECMRRGESHATAKLTEDSVREIRRRLLSKSETQAALARAFGISQTTVSSIGLGKTWRHVH